MQLGFRVQQIAWHKLEPSQRAYHRPLDHVYLHKVSVFQIFGDKFSTTIFYKYYQWRITVYVDVIFNFMLFQDKDWRMYWVIENLHWTDANWMNPYDV